jgi:hypothetical protein
VLELAVARAQHLLEATEVRHTHKALLERPRAGGVGELAGDGRRGVGGSDEGQCSEEGAGLDDEDCVGGDDG